MQFDKSDWLFFALIAVAIFLYFYIKKHFKMPKVGSLSLTTGAVKSGKTTFTLALAYSNYRRIHRAWKVQKFFCKLFKKPISEEPLFYSNIPLAFPYVPITKELILRQTRFRYGSVAFINEASLLADNSINNATGKSVAERVMFFNKLIGHETRGGLLFYDTQAIGDMPAVSRRCLGQYFYVHHLAKWIPFFIVAYVKECRYSEDGSVISVDTNDLEDGLHRVLIRKSIFKKFDCYCYSVFTDKLSVEDKVIVLPKGADLRCNNILSFKEYESLQ